MDKYQELIKDLESEYNYLTDAVETYFEEYGRFQRKCDRYSKQITEYLRASEEKKQIHARDMYEMFKPQRDRARDTYYAYKDSSRAIKRVLDKAKEQDNEEY